MIAYLLTPVRLSGSFGTGSSPPSINDCTLSKLIAEREKVEPILRQDTIKTQYTKKNHTHTTHNIQ